MKSDLASPLIQRVLSSDNANELQALAILTYKDTYKDQLSGEEIDSRIAGKYQFDHFLSLLGDPEHFFWGVYSENKLVAYLHLSTQGRCQSVSTEQLLQLSRIYVHSDHQNKGIGRTLMRTAENFAKNRALKGLWLQCFEENLKSIQFYEISNYQIVGKERFEIIPGKMRFDVVMIKRFP